jgi:C1 tetrahydrofolate synthase, putative
MAILSLCNNLKDAKERIKNIVVAFSKSDPPEPVTCEDLGISGAVAVLLKGSYGHFF